MNPLKFTSIQAPNADAISSAIAAYVAARLGVEAESVMDVPWQERGRRLFAGDIHIGWVCGLPYVCAEVESPGVWLPLVAPVMAGARYGRLPVYFSDVVVCASAPIRQFSDLRGRRWAYNEPRSHSGNGVVRDHLAGLGATGDYFGEVIEAGAHQAALEMILDGRVDASAIDSTVLETELRARPELSEQIRVVETLGPSPAPLWVAHRTVSQDIRLATRAAFLGMAGDPMGQAILFAGAILGFTTVEDADYDPIRRMARRGESVIWRRRNDEE